LEWCQHHVNDYQHTNDDDDSRRRNTEIDDWDQRFLSVEQDMLFEIILVKQKKKGRKKFFFHKLFKVKLIDFIL